MGLTTWSCGNARRTRQGDGGSGEPTTREVVVSHEHSGYEWLPFPEALARTSFEGPKKVLTDAETFLSSARSIGDAA